ncbi:hypothetical protein CEXT_274411 [Caerostris extrusa]|uniref:Uncharacterized protein n=1 Tax=Caerostris extrusa TaxID=172846 RepID=A0AAV4P2S1_CAEEX|nr:hypothetical protein CEXT_274411 [Caerostris extrusa]
MHNLISTWLLPRTKQKGNTTVKPTSKCYQSEKDLVRQSAIDLSDTWLSLGVTKDNLSRFGHKAEDLIIQCTYNSNDCWSNGTSYRVDITQVTSPIFGLCHTLSVKNNLTDQPATVKRGGTTQGTTSSDVEHRKVNVLGLDIFRIRREAAGPSSGHLPHTAERGIIASPGRSVHIGVRRVGMRISLLLNQCDPQATRFTKLLPGNEGSCTEHFQDSQIFERLKIMDLDFDLDSLKYTYEHCNTLCQNTMLFSQCQCLDEQPTGTARAKWKFCSPCNKTEAKCRSAVIRNFTDVGNDCDDLCKPSCKSVRYDISLSKADWPNLNHQQFVMNRSFDQWNHIPEALGLLGAFEQDDANVTDFVNDTFSGYSTCLSLIYSF